VHRPWGSYQSLDQRERYQVKRIVVKQGGRLSLQIHQHRIRGRDDDQILGAGQRDELLLGGDVRAAWVDEDGGTMRGIPGRFLRRQFPNRLSMRRTRRHRRINRPVAKASVHGIYFTVRVGIAPIEKRPDERANEPELVTDRFEHGHSISGRSGSKG
jgi:hypothetical protein